MRFFLALFTAIFFVGCGYRPASVASKELLGDSVFVSVVISSTDPQNTVALKDAIRDGVVNRLGRKLLSKQQASSKIIASLNSISFTPISYDRLGYITAFRIDISVNFKVDFKDGSTFSKTTFGDYTFKVSTHTKYTTDLNSIISEFDRYNAIVQSSSQAFDEFIATLSIKGLDR